jgi:hypothetical protein
MATVTIAADAPPWAHHLVQHLIRDLDGLASELHRQPLRLARYQAGDLPAPARWPGCVIAVEDGGHYGLRLSDGVVWRKVGLET